jgi:Flp pilus assembly protein TadG
MRRLLAKNQKGESIIEFAMVLPILLLVVFGITEFGRAIMTSNILSSASREGARLFVRASNPGPDETTARIDTVLVAARLKLANRSITIDTTSLSDCVKVTVTYNFQVLSGKILDFLGPRIWVLKGTTVMRREL